MLENCRPWAWSGYLRLAVHDGGGGDDGGGGGGGGRGFHDDGVMHSVAEGLHGRKFLELDEFQQ